MDKVCLIILFIFVGLIYVICTICPPNNHPTNKDRGAIIIIKDGVEYGEWGYIKGPSGMCYEVLKGVGPKGFSYMGMSRVPRTLCEKPPN
jgi:hypothetical protein